MADLAGSLGVDLESTDIASKRDAYVAATNELRATAASRPEITVLGISTSPDLVYIASPPRFPDLTEYGIQGVQVVGPPETDEYGYYLPLSWEEADQVVADIVFYDARAGHPTLEDLMAIPTFAATPAAQAGQLLPWFIPSAHSYSRNTAAIQALNEAIQNAVDVVEEG
jgi:iron complex transport system substrate-binding protein